MFMRRMVVDWARTAAKFVKDGGHNEPPSALMEREFSPPNKNGGTEPLRSRNSNSVSHPSKQLRANPQPLQPLTKGMACYDKRTSVIRGMRSRLGELTQGKGGRCGIK